MMQSSLPSRCRLAGAAALITTGSAQAAPTLSYSLESTSAFLVANNLWSATVSVSGFAPGENLQGFLGTAALGLPDFLRAKATQPTAGSGQKSVILIWLDGGPSHLETFDPKPEAPAINRRAAASGIAAGRSGPVV